MEIFRKLAMGFLVATGLLVVTAGEGRAVAGYGEATNLGRDLVAVQGCDGVTVQIQIREREMLNLINERRRTVGMRAFCVHPKLQRAAREHTADMVERNYYSHNTPEGKTPLDRARKLGYRTDYVAECLTGGDAKESPRVAFNTWMNSPPHRRAIDANWYNPGHEIGVGTADEYAPFYDYTETKWAIEMSGGHDPSEVMPVPIEDDVSQANTRPKIWSISPGAEKVGKRVRIRAKVRDAETNLKARHIKVRLDGKKMRFRYNRRTDRMVVRTQRLNRGKHILLIRANDGQKKVVKRVRFQVR